MRSAAPVSVTAWMRTKASNFLLHVRAGRIPRGNRIGECQIPESRQGDGDFAENVRAKDDELVGWVKRPEAKRRAAPTYRSALEMVEENQRGRSPAVSFENRT